jgi:hypothetical protein
VPFGLLIWRLGLHRSQELVVTVLVIDPTGHLRR